MKLFEPITIRGVEFKNRIVMSPMQVGVGMRGARARAYYGQRARGGVGTIITGTTSVDVFATDDAWGQPGAVNAFLNGTRPLIDDIHQAGARIGVQLWQGNRFPAGMSMQDMRGEPVAPSATAEERELTIPEIKTIISKFAQAAANVQRAGFDFIEIHGAHDYLVRQFFSPATNQRDDEYGGDLARRMRFGIELVSAIRAAVGNDYPISYRLGAWEEIPGGITLDDGIQFAIELEKASVDVINVSIGGTVESGLTVMPGPEYPEGTFVHLAEAIKHQVKIPVAAVGRFTTPQFVEEVLAQGKADMVAIGRQLIADPYWPEKVATGRTKDIIPCISCNVCSERLSAGFNLSCSVNAVTGREGELTMEPAPKPKKVMVVGGGPGGMEAARVAALRGHKVTLYERQNELGGQLIPAAVPPHKGELPKLNRYLAYQLEKSTVQVKLGAEVTPELVDKEKPDAVILATGSMHLIPEIPGMSRNKVANATDVLLGRVNVGKKVVVIGGSLVGCETALYLAQKVKKLTIVEMLDSIMPDDPPNWPRMVKLLTESKVKILTGAKVLEITDKGIVIAGKNKRRSTLETDTIVLATGATPNDQLAKSIEGKVSEIYLAGDCVQPKRIVNAIDDGARLGREV